MRILTWNLFHGRAVPGAGRDLLEEFSRQLTAWDWDVALLQEVPPWWPSRLAAAARAEQRTALTSRNSALPLRRLLAEWRPDMMKSNGGGANAMLVRGKVSAYRRLRLRAWPERRVGQLARLDSGICVANLHGSVRVELAEVELRRLWDEALAWAGSGPLVLGGDLNLRNPTAPRADVVHLASRDVDHLFARGLQAAGDAQLLPRDVTVDGREVALSDHVPLLAEAR